MDNRLTKEMVKDIFLPKNYIRGLDYYNKGKVEDCWFDRDTSLWHADVAGGFLYHVVIGFRDGFIELDCDCPAFESHGECKHAAAALLRISEKESRVNSKKSKRQYEMTNQLMNVFANYMNRPNQSNFQQELKTEFIFKMNDSHPFRGPAVFKMEMKVGTKRLYVVKNIKDFLESVEEKRPHHFGKHFTYDPVDHMFNEQDHAIITMLHSIVKNEELYQSFRSYGNSFFASEKREIIIPPFAADDLLLKLKDVTCIFEHRGISYRSVEILWETLPLSFVLKKGNAGDFQLDIGELQKASFFERYGWLYYDQKLVKLSREQQTLLEEFLNFTNGISNSALSIDQTQMEPFLKNALPGLEKIGKLEITNEVSEKIVKRPLKTKIFVDHQEDEMQVKVEFHYGESIIDPFASADKNKDGQILMRDGKKEQAITSIIEDSFLKFNGQSLYMKGEEEIYDFLYRVLPRLEAKAEIYTSSNVSAWMNGESYTPVTSVDFSSDNNWLEVQFEVEGIEKQEIEHVLQSIIERKKYYRLNNGAFLSLEQDDFQMVGRLFEEFSLTPEHYQNGQVQIPVYRAHQVENVLKDQYKASAHFSKAFRDLINDLKHPEDLEFKVPDTLQASLRDYQKIGFQWMKALSHYRLGGILADDMGLGKTLQSIAYILSERQENVQMNPVLVVAPASLVYNWKSEFEKFAPKLKVDVILGTPKERQDMFLRMNSSDVWITSYPTLRQDIEQYSEHEFSAIILDEAQTIKNSRSKTAKAVHSLKSSKRFALSGTPIENSLEELWAIFQAILPGFFPSQQAFLQLSNEKIARMIRPFILRRVKKDVLKELPEKIETVHLSELTKPQKELYLAYLEKIQGEAKQSVQAEGFNKSRIKILAGLTRLRQLCCHPSLFLENYHGDSGKLDQLLDLVRNALEGGKRLLIFSQFTSMLHIVRQRFDQEGTDYFYLDGQTPSMERVEMANRFNNGEKNIFLISLKAGGTGLNLTGADTVILYDLWWNPAAEEQAAGRAHRIGQKNVVQVIRLIARGTIEEKIYALQQKKRELIEQVIAPGEAMLTSLTEEEIMELLS